MRIFVSDHRNVHDYSLLLSADNPINFRGTKAAKYDVVDFLKSPLLPVEQRKVDANSPWALIAR